MTPEKAAKILDIYPTASPKEIEEQYYRLHGHFRGCLLNAPTKQLQNEYQQNIREIQRACRALGVEIPDASEEAAPTPIPPTGEYSIANPSNITSSHIMPKTVKKSPLRTLRRVVLTMFLGVTLWASLAPQQAWQLSQQFKKEEQMYTLLLLSHYKTQDIIVWSKGLISKSKDNYEPNNSFSEAKLLEPNSYSGLDVSQQDSDWFIVYVPQNHNLQVGILYASALGKLKLGVYNAEKTTMTQVVTTKEGEEAYLKNIPPGNYYISVETNSTESMKYRLDVFPEPINRLQLETLEIMATSPQTVFPHTEDQIYWQLKLKNLWKVRSHNFSLAWTLETPQGKVQNKEEKNLTQGSKFFEYKQAFPKEGKFWPLGKYRFTLWINEQQINSQEFTVIYALDKKEQKALEELEQAVLQGKNICDAAYQKEDYSHLLKVPQYINKSQENLQLLKAKQDHPRIAQAQKNYQALLDSYEKIRISGKERDLYRAEHLIKEGLKYCQQATTQGKSELLKKAHECYVSAQDDCQKLQQEKSLKQKLVAVEKQLQQLRENIDKSGLDVKKYHEREQKIAGWAQIAEIDATEGIKLCKLAEQKNDRKHLLKAYSHKQTAIHYLKKIRELREDHPKVKTIFDMIENLSAEIFKVEKSIANANQKHAQKIAMQKKQVSQEYKQAQVAIKNSVGLLKQAQAKKDAGVWQEAQRERQKAWQAKENIQGISPQHKYVKVLDKKFQSLDKALKKTQKYILHYWKTENKVLQEAALAEGELKKSWQLQQTADNQEDLDILKTAVEHYQKALQHLKIMYQYNSNHAKVKPLKDSLDDLAKAIRITEDKIKNKMQIWYVQDEFPKQQIEEGWKRKYTVTEISHDDSQWMLVMTKGYSPQIWHRDGYFPQQKIEEGIARGYHVTHLSFYDRTWVLIMTEGYKKQFAFTSAKFPEEKIQEEKKRGYHVSEIVYGRDRWGVVMTQGSTPQILYKDYAFPSAKIEEGWTKGYVVTSLSSGDNFWTLVMTKGNNSQIWHKDAVFPQEKIENRIQQGFYVTNLVYGNRIWAMIMSK